MGIKPPIITRMEAAAARFDTRLNRADANTHEAFHNKADLPTALARAGFETLNLARWGAAKAGVAPRGEGPRRMPAALRHAGNETDTGKLKYLERRDASPLQRARQARASEKVRIVSPPGESMVDAHELASRERDQHIFGDDPRTKLAPDLANCIPRMPDKFHPLTKTQLRAAAEALAVDARTADLSLPELQTAASLAGNAELGAYLQSTAVRRAFGRLKPDAGQDAPGAPKEPAGRLDPRFFRRSPDVLVAAAHRADDSHASLLKRAIHASDGPAVHALIQPEFRDAFAATVPPVMNSVTGRAEAAPASVDARPEPPHPGNYLKLPDGAPRYAADARRVGHTHAELLDRATRSRDLEAHTFLAHPKVAQAFRRYPANRTPSPSAYLPPAGASRAQVQAAADAFARAAVDAGTNRAELFALGRLRGSRDGLRFLRSAQMREAFDKLMPPGSTRIQLKDRHGADFEPDFNQPPAALAAQAHRAGVSPFELFEAARMNGEPGAARAVAGKAFNRAMEALRTGVAPNLPPRPPNLPPRPPKLPLSAAPPALPPRPAAKPSAQAISMQRPAPLPTPPETPPKTPPALPPRVPPKIPLAPAQAELQPSGSLTRAAVEQMLAGRAETDRQAEAFAQRHLGDGRSLPGMRREAMERGNDGQVGFLDHPTVRSAFARVAANRAPNPADYLPTSGTRQEVRSQARALAAAAKATGANGAQLYEKAKQAGDVKAAMFMATPQVDRALDRVGLAHSDVIVTDRSGAPFRADFRLEPKAFAQAAHDVGVTPREVYEAAVRNGDPDQIAYMLRRDVLAAFKTAAGKGKAPVDVRPATSGRPDAAKALALRNLGTFWEFMPPMEGRSAQDKAARLQVEMRAYVSRAKRAGITHADLLDQARRDGNWAEESTLSGPRFRQAFGIA